MANPLTIGAFPDCLDPRFREIVDGELALEVDEIGTFYTVVTPTQRTERGSALTPMGLWSEFTGSMPYDGVDQGYDWNTTVKEFALATSIDRPLVEYDQFDIIEGRWRGIARSGRQTRQVHAAETFVNAFIVDPGYTHTEGVALCSDSHTSPRAGVSTTVGFDNNVTAALAPASLKAIYIQGRKFRDNAGQPIDGFEFDMLLVPVDLRDRALEIMQTGIGLDTAEGNINVLKSRYGVKDWIRLEDTNNYFLINKAAMKENLFWFDKIKPEYARVEEFDTVIAKYRGYGMWHRGRADWRWIVGASVS